MGRTRKSAKKRGRSQGWRQFQQGWRGSGTPVCTCVRAGAQNNTAVSQLSSSLTTFKDVIFLGERCWLSAFHV